MLSDWSGSGGEDTHRNEAGHQSGSCQGFVLDFSLMAILFEQVLEPRIRFRLYIYGWKRQMGSMKKVPVLQFVHEL